MSFGYKIFIREQSLTPVEGLNGSKIGQRKKLKHDASPRKALPTLQGAPEQMVLGLEAGILGRA